VPSKSPQSTSPQLGVVSPLIYRQRSSFVHTVGYQGQKQILSGWTIGLSTVFYVVTYFANSAFNALNRLFRSSIAFVHIAVLATSQSRPHPFHERVTIMPTVQETAYPRLKSNITLQELTAIYTPTTEELTFAKQSTINGSNTRLGFLILLKTFQRLGYAVLNQDVPASIIQHIAMAAHLNISKRDLEYYDTAATRKRHLGLIRDYLHLHSYNSSAKAVMVEAIRAAASTKQDLADLINVAIEELVRQRFELPAFNTLNRTAQQIRAQVMTTFYQQVNDRLNLPSRQQLDELLTITPIATMTSWNDLKQDAGRPTLTHLQTWIDRLQQLRQLPEHKSPLMEIPEVKVKHFAQEAMTLDAARMKEMEPAKRYTLMVALISAQYACTLDDLAEMFIKQMQQMHQKGKTALVQYRAQTQSNTDELIATLREMVLAYQQEGDIPHRFAAIEAVVGEESQTIVQQCDAHLNHADNNYFSLIQEFYKSHRAILFRLLEVLPLRSSSQDKTLEAAIQFLLEHRNNRQASLPIITIKNAGTDSEQRLQHLDLSWIPAKWWYLVTEQRTHVPMPEAVNRRHFEVCVFSHILLELKSGDLYIEGSSDYGDYYSQLIDWEQYDSAIVEYGQQVELPTDPKAFVAHVQQWLTTCATTFDDDFPANADVDYQRDRLVIRKPKPKKVPGASELKAQIAARIRPVNLLDSLIDTELWLNWTRFFKPKSGHDAKLDRPIDRYLATTFCYGCNLGPAQTAVSLQDFDRRQVSHVHQRHIDVDKLHSAITVIINAYNRFNLPKYWGTGHRASVDGTKWDIYENNLLAEYHIRYGGYGGIAYYHVSDTYIALFSHFIPCGVWEAVYILDGLLQNQSEIQPDTIHGDTQAQSATVFALAYLLGIRLMPRIRNWKDLKFYRPARSVRYKHVDNLFTDPVNWELIETHLPDMLRVALSVKAGKINASTVLRKLGTNSNKNKLYQAFHALGCAVRTGFLLQYLNNAQLRSTIQGATNKSESFNHFVQWLSFGGEGVITSNNREEQRKMIRYNHLVANCLIFYNVYEISRILNELKQEGYPLDADAVATLSPYWTQHVNRFGSYDLNLDRCPPPIDYDLIVIQDIESETPQ
jgi:TnpA family transposase